MNEGKDRVEGCKQSPHTRLIPVKQQNIVHPRRARAGLKHHGSAQPSARHQGNLIAAQISCPWAGDTLQGRSTNLLRGTQHGWVVCNVGTRADPPHPHPPPLPAPFPLLPSPQPI